jgi:GNAT superfamily N-acetyltransferase
LSFLIRTFNPEEDIPRLVTLRTDIEAVDQVGTNTSEAAVRAQMKWLGHDPRQDRWVAEAAEEQGRFIGHAWTFSQSPKRSILSVAVHPAWRCMGLGSSLLQIALQRAREKDAIQIVSGTEANNEVGRAFLECHGFSAIGHNRFLSAPEISSLPMVELPTGYSIQSFDTVNDLSILVKACNQSYQDMWGHRENTEPSTEEFYGELMRTEPDYFPPDGIFLVFTPNHVVAGVCFCRVEGGQKIIDSPAIAPAFSQKGLLRPLVLVAMHWLNGQTGEGMQLQTWGDSETAIGIYNELGFVLDENNHMIEYLWSRKFTNM